MLRKIIKKKMKKSKIVKVQFSFFLKELLKIRRQKMCRERAENQSKYRAEIERIIFKSNSIAERRAILISKKSKDLFETVFFSAALSYLISMWSLKHLFKFLHNLSANCSFKNTCNSHVTFSNQSF